LWGGCVLCFPLCLFPSDLEQSTVTSGTTQQAKQALNNAAVCIDRMRPVAECTVVRSTGAAAACSLRKPLLNAPFKDEAVEDEEADIFEQEWYEWCLDQLRFTVQWFVVLRVCVWSTVPVPLSRRAHTADGHRDTGEAWSAKWTARDSWTRWITAFKPLLCPTAALSAA
jgi:hypothetical protein